MQLAAGSLLQLGEGVWSTAAATAGPRANCQKIIEDSNEDLFNEDQMINEIIEIGIDTETETYKYTFGFNTLKSFFPKILHFLLLYIYHFLF